MDEVSYHLLKEIYKSVEAEDLLYIKQFDITSSSQPDEFEKILRKNQENNVEEYMKPIRNSINSILSLNQEELFIKMDEYLDSLKKYAHRTDIEDAYSKMKIFNTKNFNKKIIQISKSESPIFENKTGKFTELVLKTSFENTKAVQKSLGSSNIAMKEIYDSFYVDLSPYRYLTSLKNKGIEEGKLYKALFKIKYVVLNEKDTPVSGGETAEFNLLNQIYKKIGEIESNDLFE